MRKEKILFSLFLVLLGILFRTVWHLGENIEFVTTSALLSAAYLGFWYSLIIPLLIMMITDFILGNTNIFIFTWSAYLAIGILGWFVLGRENSKKEINKFNLNKTIKATSLGILGSIWFFLWTNFGVWLLDSWGFYPRTLSGLILAYILGLPFLKFNLLGNIFFVPLSFIIVEFSLVIKLNLKKLFHLVTS